MISEEKLQEWERLVQEQKEDEIDFLYVFETYDIIPQLIAEVRELKFLLNATTDASERLEEERDNQLRNVTKWVVDEFSRKGCPSGSCRGSDCLVMNCAECWSNKVHRVVQNA